MNNIAINVENVSKMFNVHQKKYKKGRKHFVLRNLNLTIHCGQVVGIIGRNGSGKSTLLKIISGIMQPSSGKITINGDVASILELGMGFHPEMSGRENIVLKGMMYGFSFNEIQNMMDNIIEYSELSEYIEYPVKTYSSGMVGRLAFAIMVHVKSSIMIVDEVLSTGDEAFGLKSGEYFKKLKKEGHTIILVSHSLNTIRELCDKVFWLEKGLIKEEGDARTICGHYEKYMKESFEIIDELSRIGVPYAENIMGIFYRDGKYVEPNIELAKQWFRKSANSYYAEGCINLADLLLKEDYQLYEKEAIRLYTIASKTNNNLAKRKLASMYRGSENISNVERSLLKKAKLGDPVDMFNYGEYLMKSDWDPNKVTDALKWFEMSANHNYPPSQFRMGELKINGIGCDIDVQTAIDYFGEAAHNLHTGAQYTLGTIYNEGACTEYNETLALYWYMKAARQGDQESQFFIAKYYDKKGDESNKRRWFEIYSRTPTFIQDVMYASTLIRQGNLSDKKAAFEIYLELSKMESVESMLQLGLCYRDGLGTEIDLSKSKKMFFASAIRGNTLAQILVGEMLWNSKTGSSIAIKYMKLAADWGNAYARYRLSQYYLYLGMKDEYLSYLKLASKQGEVCAQNEWKKVNEILNKSSDINDDFDLSYHLLKNRFLNHYIIIIKNPTSCITTCEVNLNSFTLYDTLSNKIVISSNSEYEHYIFEDNYVEYCCSKTDNKKKVSINGAEYFCDCEDWIFVVSKAGFVEYSRLITDN